MDVFPTVLSYCQCRQCQIAEPGLGLFGRIGHGYAGGELPLQKARFLCHLRLQKVRLGGDDISF